MKRNLEPLSNQTFDVLVIGGGIFGAVAAWDAVLRGLSVALIERGDFGGGTSQNSLKIIHGGLRYLQDGNLSRIRKMAYERTTWMKIAPHLIHPLSCLTPTQQKISRSRLAMSVALPLNDLLSFDRNRLADPEKYLPGGRIISPQECAQILPGFDVASCTGAAVWHDAQIHNSERLVLEFILSAVDTGAKVANYVEAIGFLKEKDRIVGVKAKDVLSGQVFEIRSRVVINCAGVWVNELLEKATIPSKFTGSVAMNLVVDKVWPNIAAGLPSHPGAGKRSQILFIVPWRNKSLIGTWHIHLDETPDKFTLKESVVQDFINEVNTAHPELQLSLNDVYHVPYGFLPINHENAQKPKVKLMRDDQVIDHERTDRLPGLISVVSVKYTTSRVTAEKAVDLAVEKLANHSPAPCKTHDIPLNAGCIEDFKDFLDKAQSEWQQSADTEVIEHLVISYGANFKNLLSYTKEQPGWGERVDPQLPVTKAEVVHAARNEMVVSLADVIMRRTELGANGLPSLTAVETCAELVANEQGWSVEDQKRQIASIADAYPFKNMERVSV